MFIDLSSAIYQGQTVTISYDQSAAGSDALADADGNKLASFTDFAVRNTSNQVPPTCTLNPGDLWCGTLTVGTGTSGGTTFYGYAIDPGWGSLSPNTFTYNGNTIYVSTLQYDVGPDSILRFAWSGNFGTGNFVLHVGSQSFSLTSGIETTFASHGLSWSVGDTVVVRLSGETVPTSCTLNPGDLWCGVVTVEDFSPGGTLSGHGFVDIPNVADVGALSDPGFSVVTNGVTTSYTLNSVFTGVGSSAGVLFFGLTSALTAADQAKLVLHVDGRSDPLAFSGVTPNAFHTYQWDGRGLDWSSEDYVTLRLREAAVLPGLSVWDAAASGGSEMAFSVTLSEAPRRR